MPLFRVEVEQLRSVNIYVRAQNVDEAEQVAMEAFDDEIDDQGGGSTETRVVDASRVQRGSPIDENWKDGTPYGWVEGQMGPRAGGVGPELGAVSEDD